MREDDEVIDWVFDLYQREWLKEHGVTAAFEKRLAEAEEMRDLSAKMAEEAELDDRQMWVNELKRRRDEIARMENTLSYMRL